MLHFAASRVDVLVITSQQLYDDPFAAIAGQTDGGRDFDPPSSDHEIWTIAGWPVEPWTIFIHAARCSHPVMFSLP
jgi:hypothetical protein